VRFGVDDSDLSQAGWGILFAPGLDPRIRAGLEPLIELRKAQGAAPFALYEQDGYRPRETVFEWLKRRKVRLDVVDPAKGVPFYLLIVASPETISFEFQYLLDLYWAVGRLWFDDVEDFQRYAESVVRYETSTAAARAARQLAIFAPRHDFDPATQLFTRQVALPLRDGEGARPEPVGRSQGFALRTFLGADASKEALGRILRGQVEGGPPALLFSGGHGMAFEPGDPLQRTAQGALVCQDWDRGGRIAPEHWFAASDVPEDAGMHGLIHFMFACYGGGVTELDNFDRLNNAPRRISPAPFIARLPQALLSHPRGGALAVLAHIERAWAYSFRSDSGIGQIQGFQEVICRLLAGQRIGSATDTFNMRWAGLSTQVAQMQLDLFHNPNVPLGPLGRLWVARDDARNFIILGDPAVRLRLELQLRPQTEMACLKPPETDTLLALR
jgi:hypothetical protein